MPGGDRTGPLGQGSLTGRGLGQCGAGLRRGLGFRRGFGIGLGRGFRWRMLAPTPTEVDYTTEPVNLNKTDEKKILEAELKEVKTEMQEIEKRLKELK
jgi:hypothetical protein